MSPNLWQETPLVYSSSISDILGVSAYLKLENLQPSQSFKYRGISLFAQRAKEQKGNDTHLVAASGGNAGLATACAAKALDVKCSVYIPEGVTQNTLDVLQRQDAKVVVIGRHYAEALEAAKMAVQRDETAVLVPAYEHETIWEGHGSMVQEIATQLAVKPDYFFCSVGGGGLLGGLIDGCAKLRWDDVPIIALETIGSDCFFHSMSCSRSASSNGEKSLPADVHALYDEENGVTLAHFDRFTSRASGSLGASQPAPRVVRRALERKGGVKCVSVPDELSMRALGLFVDDHKLLVELACSTALTPAYTPAIFDKVVYRGSSKKKLVVVFIVCGGFKISLAEAEEYKQLVNMDVTKGGKWSVMLDEGEVIQVEKRIVS